MRSLAVLVISGLALAGLACEPEKPGTPTYTKDVAPIFAAHCTRCHGAGGTLQGDPPPDQYPLGKPPSGYNPGPPFYCHLETFDDAPADCSADGGAPPARAFGARTCAALGLIKSILPTMPPPPAPKLNDWELDVVTRWLANPIR